MAMREENLAGESFYGKLATGDPLKDTARAKAMEEQVLGMLERQESRTMMLPKDIDLGRLMYMCKACGHAGLFVLDDEEKFVRPICEECKSPDTAIGSEKSLRERYNKSKALN